MPLLLPSQIGKRPRSTMAKSGQAESQARDSNMKLQLQLARQLLRSNRDNQAGVRETERQERSLLLDLARILDAKLSPSIDQWFERRRVVQTSRLPDTRTADQMLARMAKSSSASRRESYSGGGGGDDGGGGGGGSGGGGANQTPAIAASAPAAVLQSPASSDSVDKRQRILEAKRADWFGFTSVSFGAKLLQLQQRSQTAVATSDRMEGQDSDDEADAEIGGEGSRTASAHHVRRAVTSSRQVSKQHGQKSRSKSASARHYTLRTA